MGIGSAVRHRTPTSRSSTSCCRSASRSTRSTRCRTRSTSTAACAGRRRTSCTTRRSWRCSRTSSPGRSCATPTSRRSSQRLAPRLTSGLAASGIFFFACGLAKKLLFADDARAARRPRCSRATSTLGLVIGLGRGARLLAAALLRLLRLLRHGRRPGVPARLPVPAELQLAVQGGEHLRLLAALAHVAVVLAARLPVHPARRIARQPRPQTLRNL